MVTFKHQGNFENFENFAKKMKRRDYLLHNKLDTYAKKGVRALSGATPVDTGKTAASWGYNIYYTKNQVKIIWTNSSTTKDGIPIVILLQYGHGNGHGGYIQGRDFITPAIKPIFDEILENVWKEVERS